MNAKDKKSKVFGYFKNQRWIPC